MKTYLLIWRLILSRPWLYVANAASWIIIHISPVLPGLIIREFFDMLNGQSRLGFGIWGLIGLLAATATARIVNILLGALADTNHRFSMSALLRRNALESMLLTPKPARDQSPGETVNILEEDGKQVEDAISWSVDTMGMTGFAIVSAIILVGISPKLTLLVFLPLIAVMVISQAASDRLERYRRASREATSLFTEAIGEAFGTVQAIKVAGAEDRVTAHLRRLGDKRRDAMLKDKLLTRVLDSVFENAAKVGTGIILLLAAGMLQSGEISVGDFALFVYYIEFVTDFAAFIGYFTVHYKQAGVALGRLAGLMSKPEGLVDHNPLYLHSSPPDAPDDDISDEERLVNLSVSGLTARYPDSENGISDCSFELQRGTFTVIAGRIGSGKTTLVRTLLGFLPAESGSVLWNGRAVGDLRSFFSPPRSAYAPQVPHLFSDTLRNNIMLGIKEGDADLMGAVRAAALEEDLQDLDKGLDTVIGPKGAKLSGGQQQRVAVARMLVRRAELMVFDDVSSALDVETERQLWMALANKPQFTFLVISNRKGVILGADKVLVMDGGRIIAQGEPCELSETCEELRAILEEARGS